MASQGRCSAMLAVVLLVVSTAAVAQGASHTVGGSLGWGVPGTLNRSATYLSDWAATQTFVVDDTLVFTYSNATHNVLTVAAAAYGSCNTTSPLLTSTTGNDTLVLVAGAHYYVCGTPGHCPSNQKVMINVTAAPPGTITPPASPGTPAAPAGSDAAGNTVTVVQVIAAVVVSMVASLAFW